jgi:hypothetical protein
LGRHEKGPALCLYRARDCDAFGRSKSQRAIQVNIEIMRIFVKLGQLMASSNELSHKIDELEKKYDHQFQIVFDAIRGLMTPLPARTKPIGFRPKTLKK